MKRALKQAKAYRDKILQLSTIDYELRKVESEFIGHSFDYTTPLYRKIKKIKGMEQETEGEGYLQVLTKPNKNKDGFTLIVRTSHELTSQDFESMSVLYKFNDSVDVKIKVIRAVGYRGFDKLIKEIRRITNAYLKNKLGGKK